MGPFKEGKATVQTVLPPVQKGVSSKKNLFTLVNKFFLLEEIPFQKESGVQKSKNRKPKKLSLLLKKKKKKKKKTAENLSSVSISLKISFLCQEIQRLEKKPSTEKGHCTIKIDAFHPKANQVIFKSYPTSKSYKYFLRYLAHKPVLKKEHTL